MRRSIQNVIEVTVTIENESARQLGATSTERRTMGDDTDAVVRQTADAVITDDNSQRLNNHMDAIENDPRQEEDVPADTNCKENLNQFSTSGIKDFNFFSI